MPAEAREAIVEMARRLPETTFIWKYEKPEDEVGLDVDNLIKVAWTPQQELLREYCESGITRHSPESGRIAAFMTHAGMGSTYEAVNAAVPLLLVGLFGDQMRNAAMIAAHGGAIALDKWRLDDVDYLVTAMKSILKEPSYAENAKHLAARLKARPFSSRELLVRHTVFVAEHGLLQMTPVSTKMNFVQKHFLDAISLVIIGFVLIVWILLAVFRRAVLMFTAGLSKIKKD